MSTLPYTSPTGVTGTGTYTAEFTGDILVFLWAGGGGGAGGTGASKGGSGGGGGALSVFRIPVVTGGVYSYFVGSGGAGGAWPSASGSDGTDTYWGDGTLYRAERGYGGTSTVGGAGGDSSGSLGDTVQPGNNGVDAINSNWSGQNGGDGGGVAGGDGGVATGGGGQGAGGPGSVPGGGGSGGGQTSTGAGGAGAIGQVYIIEAPATKIGYHMLGLDTDGVYLGHGQYDYTAEADGVVSVELWGSGGGGAGGVPLSLQGRSGGGGGAYVKKLATVYGGVVYRRVVPTGGNGSAVSSGAAGSAGGDASFTLAPLAVATKQISSNVAILTFTAAKHGYSVGDSIIVAGVDATFNGTFTITAINAARTELRYAKTASNVGPSSTTGTVSPNFNIALAKGGSGAASGSGVGTGGAGGLASASIGDTKYSGESGEDCWGAQTGGVVGTNGAYGGYPNGGIGGWGGKHNEDDNTVVAGANGEAPGGGGGGGAGQNSGNAGNGADGGAVIRYVLSLGSIVENGVKRPILQIRVKDGSGVVHTATDASVVHSGVKISQKSLFADPDAGIRAKPSYIPAGYEDRFDIATGRFNWDSVTHVGPALAADNFHWVHVGDSVSDGSTSLNRTNPLDYTINYPTAYPRLARALLASLLGTTEQGTGLVRPANVATCDPMWVRGSWSDKTHYLESSTTSHVATFTPTLARTALRVTTLGVGSVTITIDNVLIGTMAGGANAAAVQSQNFTGLGAGVHVLKVSPAVGGVVSQILGADAYTPGDGVKVHNIAQGGSRAALGSASSPQQNVWGDTGAAAPTNMTNIYSQATSCFERRPDAVVLALGGNDAFQLISAANIKSAMDTVGQAFDHANTDIILYPDTHNTLQIAALMDLCITRGWGMIDFFWLSRNLRSIFGLDYNGDTYGHLNSTTGVQWMRDLFVTGIRGSLT